MGPVRSRTTTSLYDGSCRPFNDTLHVATRLPGNGGGFELPGATSSCVRDLETPPRIEDRRAIEDLIRRSASRVFDPSSTARALLTEFGSFASVLAGSAARLRRVGADDAIIDAICWCRSAVALSLRGAAADRPVIGTSSALLAYLKFQMGSETTERIRVLYLNARHELLADEESATGTVDAAPFYNREIVGRAIELGATSIIVAHNHPSGDPRPSREDIACTHKLSDLCGELGMVLIDHVIVGRTDVLSLRAAGYLCS
jgi:DNA repair protein RadC